jgi:hypothetical protein
MRQKCHGSLRSLCTPISCWTMSHVVTEYPYDRSRLDQFGGDTRPKITRRTRRMVRIACDSRQCFSLTSCLRIWRYANSCCPVMAINCSEMFYHCYSIGRCPWNGIYLFSTRNTKRSMNGKHQSFDLHDKLISRGRKIGP